MKTKDFVLKLIEISSKSAGCHCKQKLVYIINRITGETMQV